MHRFPRQRRLPGIRLRPRLRRRARLDQASARRVMVVAGPAIAIGVAVEFLFDPRNGKRRRKLAVDRVRGAIRRRRRGLERQAHYEAGKMVGRAHALTRRNHTARDLDDIELVHKVESELFRDRSIPKGQISINADRGIVVLRGALADAEQIARIEGATRRIAGVRDVENLLHPPGVPAPHSRPHGNGHERRPGAH